MGACSLDIKDPDGKKRVLPIERPVLTLGRSQDNDVVLTDSELRVSRRHAVIQWNPESGATLRDERAVNGTFLNKQKVTEPVALHGGDVIGIGPHEIVFREEKSGGLAWNIEPGSVDLGALQKSQPENEPGAATAQGAGAAERGGPETGRHPHAVGSDEGSHPIVVQDRRRAARDVVALG